MNKFANVCLVGLLSLSLTACGGSDKPAGPSDIKSAEEILTTVWDSYEEDDKFFAMGGSYNEPTENAPGSIEASDVESLSALLSVPEQDAALLDDAASLVHSMNANTFTAGAYHVANADDTNTFTKDMEDALKNKQWMCGMPEVIKIYKITDSYVVSLLGVEDIVDDFEDKLEEKYPSAEAVADVNM